MEKQNKITLLFVKKDKSERIYISSSEPLKIKEAGKINEILKVDTSSSFVYLKSIKALKYIEYKIMKNQMIIKPKYNLKYYKDKNLFIHSSGNKTSREYAIGEK